VAAREFEWRTARPVDADGDALEVGRVYTLAALVAGGGGAGGGDAGGGDADAGASDATPVSVQRCTLRQVQFY
jgi:hypothetical protein